MEKRQVLLNAVMATAQVIVVGLVMFALYRFLLRTIGIEKIGIWSLVLATTSVTRLSELGLAASVTKFVAQYYARSESKKVAEIVETAALSVSAIVGLALIMLYPGLIVLVYYLVPPSGLNDALLVLPYAMLSLWLNVIACIFYSGMDGVQRADLRSLIIVFGQAVFFGSVYVLVPGHDLQGLAIAQVIQTATILIVSWCSLKTRLATLNAVPMRWSQTIFREMFKYAVNIQINGVAQLLFEPTTKAFLSTFGGLSWVGYYEMANRLVMQVRALLVSANQVVIPVVAAVLEQNPQRLPQIYTRCYQLMVYMSVPIYSLLLITIPEISELWIGRYESLFVTFALILVASWSINTLTVPAYFAYLGLGRLRWNTLSHILTGSLNVLLGFVLGKLFGGVGVLAATVGATLVGSIVPMAAFHAEHRLGVIHLFPKESRPLALACIATSLGGLLLFYVLRERMSLHMVSFAISILFVAAVGPLAWHHNMRTFLLNGFREFKFS